MTAGDIAHTSKGKSTRAAILAAAQRAFGRRGYRGGSLASIADAVGVTQQGVLHYFGSKENLLVEVLKQRDELERATGQATADEQSLFARTVALVRRNGNHREEVRFFSVLVGEALTEDYPATDYVRGRYAALARSSARMLERGQQSGQVRGDIDAESVAALLIAAMDGLQIQWLLDPGRGMTKPFELLVRLLKDYVQASDQK
jgi:AcrR family transcriptional regulator